MGKPGETHASQGSSQASSARSDMDTEMDGDVAMDGAAAEKQNSHESRLAAAGDDESDDEQTALGRLAGTYHRYSQANKDYEKYTLEKEAGHGEGEGPSGEAAAEAGGASSQSGSPSSPQSPNSPFNASSLLRTTLGRMFPGAAFDEMMQINSEVQGLVQNLQRQIDDNDPYLVLEILNALSERLLMMNGLVAERGLPTGTITRLLVQILSSPQYQDHMEVQLVACRCLYNLVEVTEEAVGCLVNSGAIEVLSAKLTEMDYIDLAEQALQTLETLSRDAGREVCLRSPLPAYLAYLDFFTIHGQRKALHVIANSCGHIPLSKFGEAQEILPTIQRIATEYTDPDCVESAWLIIARLVRNFEYDSTKLSQLVSPKLLEGIVTVFPGCLGSRGGGGGGGASSTQMVSFGSCLKLLDSLTFICESSPQLSMTLMDECRLGNVIRASLLNYERSDTAAGVRPSAPSSVRNLSEEMDIDRDDRRVSIEALMATPKELLLAILRLVLAIVPYHSDSEEGQEFADSSTSEKNDARLALYFSDGREAVFSGFVGSVFPILLNVYSATVDFKVRRMVMECVQQIIGCLSKEQLAEVVYGSSVASILASAVSQGRFVLDRSSDSAGEMEVLRPCHLIYNALTIAHMLVTRAPELFLSDFEREGLLSHAKKFLGRLDEDERVKRGLRGDIEEEEDEDVDVDGDENSEEENSDENSDENSESQMSEDDDDNEDQDDDQDRDENSEDDDDLSENDNSDDTSQTPQPTLRRRSLPDLAFLSFDKLLVDLHELCTKVVEDYKTLVASSKTPKSHRLKTLDQLQTLLQTNAEVQYTYEQWVTVWHKLALILGSASDAEDRGVASSFELASSGLIGSLLQVLAGAAPHSACLRSFQDTFCSDSSPFGTGERLPLTLLVKKLQEALDRTESFEIVSSQASSNAGSRASSMAKQLRIRLVDAETNTVETNEEESPSRQLMLMVHAIATFKTIDSFLRGRFERMQSLLRAFSSSAPSPSSAESHFEFFIDGEQVPLGTTIYGAIYKSLQKAPHETVPPRHIWSLEPHVVEYKKVPGRVPSGEEELYPASVSDDEDLSSSVSSLGDSATLQLLQLLKELFGLNTQTERPGASQALFLNYKLSAKLNRQLEEPLVVASGTLPDWSVAITRQFPFLFPLDTRIFFLQSTSFGYLRLIELWQQRAKQEQRNHTGGAGSGSGAALDSSGSSLGSGGSSSSSAMQLGRPVRHKLRLSRKKLLQGAIKVMDGYASVPGLLEIEYYDEAGTGMGPTLEFYANVSKEFCKKRFQMWRGCNEEGAPEYVNYATGLFPRPMDHNTRHYRRIMHRFSVLGKFVARSLLDSRIIDFAFNPEFFTLSRGGDSDNLQVLLDRLALVDPQLYRSLLHILLYLDREAVEGVTMDDLGLTFVLPGYPDVELVPNGDSLPVDRANLEQYVRAVLEYSVGRGIRPQIQAFTEGFSTVFPYSSLAIFSPDELVRILGNGEEDWSLATLLAVVHADHGYTLESPTVQALLELMAGFSLDERRKFLQFLTGAPKLPIGGFKALHPEFTVVLKQAEDGLRPDDYLPSVMTCANYLKLPAYSSPAVLRQRLEQAMNEGANAFLLS